MTKFLVQQAAAFRINDIYRYSLEHWGEEKAESYIYGMFSSFEQIETHRVKSRPVPAEFEVVGFFYRYEKHFVYWKYFDSGIVGIVTVLHERMHQIDRFKDDFK